MMNGMILDDNMSNLTSASNHEASISSSTRNEVGTTLYTQQQSPIASPNQPPPSKKKRNLPGNPDPASEVVALSPTTLMATNRFICEICSKGFQRDQNLQLHRRGHNLPWKLKQRTNEEVVKKKVYVCPETTCVHHEPSRALGDLTGIKKHFSRKHGEKKWKCEKCSKRYAVQSDWKAHSKICGTREYRCDCGTLFSRRDSFTTHRAFCDALTEETTRSTNLTQNHSLPSPISSSHFSHLPLIKPEQDQTHFPPWLAHLPNPGPNPMASPSPNPTLSLPSFPQPTAPPHMSATALLQKAAQMGVTMTKPTTTTITAGSGFMGLSSCEDGLLFGNISKVGVSVTSGCMEQVGATMLSGFEEALTNGMLVNPKTHFRRGNEGGAGEGLTRDFLGLRGFSHVGFPNMGGFDQMNSSSSTSYGSQVNQNQAPWQG